MDNIKMTDIAVSIENYIESKITDKYMGLIESDRITHHIRQLENRSKEFHTPSFVVLVVGPVKSGKSTFVNLLANNYVSPTHFLECTVRPSLISFGKENELVVYRSKETNHKEEQINDILDSINGLNDFEEIKNVSKDVYEFTDGNVDRYIKLDSISVASDDILLTSIKTQGGKLLQDHVFLVDMAGFDGANVNFDSPAYKAIVERADLIVFVQSSNSAISKVSSSFFQLLQTSNCSVPVCLVQNVFESAYWRDEESKRKDIEDQINYAVSQIRTTYNLDLDSKYAFNLNLGKVFDWRKGNYVSDYKEILENEAQFFENAETSMYELFQKRESIRLINCVSRTKIQRDLLFKEINHQIQILSERYVNYKSVKESFDVLRKEQINEDIDLSISQNDIIDLINLEFNKIQQEVQARGKNPKFKTEDARTFVNKLLTNINAAITKLTNQRRQKLLDVRNSEEMQHWISSIVNNTAQYLSGTTVSYECKVIDVEVDIDAKIEVNQLVPSKNLWYKHSQDELNNYFDYVHDYLCGFDAGGTFVKGYIETDVMSTLSKILLQAKDNLLNDIVNTVNGEIIRLRDLSLNTIIQDYDQFHTQLDVIGQLKTDVESLNIRINE